MRIKTYALVIAFAFVAAYEAGAQNWSSFGSVLSQMDSTQRAAFLNNLDSLKAQWSLDSLSLGGGIDSLNNAIHGTNPMTGLGDLSVDWTIGRDSLVNWLPTGSGFDGGDQNSLLQEFDRINQIWNDNNVDLNSVFDQHQADLQMPSLGTNFDTLGTEHQLSLDSLNKNLLSTLDVTPALGKGRINDLLDQLFSPSYFTALELYGGVLDAKGNYYTSDFNKTAHVIGVRSVEQFDRTWEARWALQYAGTVEPLRPQNNSDVKSKGNTPSNSKFNPLTINMNFSVMYNLSLGQITLVSLLGMETGILCPSYREFDLPYTNNNKGYTTGWGPQIGAGFAAKVGDITAFTIGTLAYGDVNLGPGYHYLNSDVEAGIRFGDKISLRVRTGRSSWATNDHKVLKSNQITVGLPLGSLFH